MLADLRSPTEVQVPHRITPSAFRVLTSQLLILVMFTFTFVLALSSALTAAPAIGNEIESGVALAILTRPISRLEVVTGKWLGLAAVSLLYVAGSSLVEFWLVKWVSDYFPPDALGFISFLAAETLVLLTLALFLSTRLNAIAAVFVVLGAYGLGWIGGIVNSIGVAFESQTVINVGTATRLIIPTDGLWHGAIYTLEPAAVIAAAQAAGPRGLASFPFYSGAPPPLPYLIWCGVWLLLVFAATVVSFARREV
jgi:ABC-type transport system involved in multi-copper enzyme maturation permease subunit